MNPTILLLLVVSAFSTADKLPLQKGKGCALALSNNNNNNNNKKFPSRTFETPKSGGSGSNCITYEDVNEAFQEAKDLSELVPGTTAKFTNDDIAKLANVIQETTRILSEKYFLSKSDIAHKLPLIDTTKTDIGFYCPAYLMDVECKEERYRSVGGRCNNVNNPNWGAARLGHHRFLPPDFADGISAPRISVTGKPLPSPRLVSISCHHDTAETDHEITNMLVAWGQFMDHDVTLTSETKDPKTTKAPKCCSGPVHPNCFPIQVPDDDPFYKDHQQKCINLARSPAGLKHNCKLGPRVASNLISSILDAGTVYGDNDVLHESLRMFDRGLLKTLDVFHDFGMKAILPLKLENPNEGCIRPAEDVYCFNAGDPRVNEQTALATVHLLLVREHNRVATELGKINPHWSDETLFQESRHIVAAIVQHITYNEWLPMVLGRGVMEEHDLILQKSGYFTGYDPKINPTTANAFATAAFRLGHTLLPGKIERWSKTHQFVAAQNLSDMLMQPYDLYKEGWIDTYLLGLSNQVIMAYDSDITEQVTNHLFQEPGKKFGLDLISLNIQRGREHGIPSYNRFRDFCGLPTITSWDDLLGIMKNDTIQVYRNMYASPEDIDLWTAGVSELPHPGTLIGPTFACLFGIQFRNYRFGDRFWYENGGLPNSFTLEQLEEIRKVKLSCVICDNSDNIDTIQVYPMVLHDHKINPRVACKSGVLPKLDLTKWRDVAAPAPVEGSRAAPGPVGGSKAAGAVRPPPTKFESPQVILEEEDIDRHDEEDVEEEEKEEIIVD